ncbi:MAG: dihydrofolate reductase family protein [Acidimicrobiales bacterium]
MPSRTVGVTMTKLTYSTSISLDGFVAGANQDRDHPLGVNGERLHEWMRDLAAWRRDAGESGGAVNASTDVYERDGNEGALVMGRNMFGGGTREWDESWIGWWGANPPFHLPVFVVTHYERPPLVLDGGTTFTFVTGGVARALELARDAADGRNVAVAGGAGVAKQFLAAGLVDELLLHVVATFLGDGVRLFDGDAFAAIEATQEWAVDAPGVTHVLYRLSPRPTL